MIFRRISKREKLNELQSKKEIHRRRQFFYEKKELFIDIKKHFWRKKIL
jgi:hypothetical protein